MARTTKKKQTKATGSKSTRTRSTGSKAAGSKGRSKAAGSKRKPLPRNAKGVVMLSGGNPQIAKGEGDAPVRAYFAALSGWKQRLGKKLDALIVQALPGVSKAVKWNSPMYGVPGQGYFLGIHVFTRYLKVAFFRGSSLDPEPPGPSKDPNTRYLDVPEDAELDEAQFMDWVKQAAALPGWMPGKPM